MIRPPLFHPRLGRAERLLIAIVTAVTFACSQSSGDHPPVYAAKGRVLFDGRPIPGGVVVYELEGGDAKGAPPSPGTGPIRATGQIGSDGRFRLMVFPGAEGVPEGQYKGLR